MSLTARYYYLFLLVACILSSNIFAKTVLDRIQSNTHEQKYGELGQFLNNKVRKKQGLLKLRKLAQAKGAHKALDAINAALAFDAERKRLKIPLGDFLQTALFIENNRAKAICGKNCHLTTKETNLAFPLTLVYRIQEATHSRWLNLTAKRASGSISKQESFELLILCMLSIDPHQRGTATELRQQLKSIFNAS